MIPDDTIVAVSSASGPAARMIVRTSGRHALDAARALAPDVPTHPRSAARADLRFARLTCPAWVYVFRAPRSYTGEDLVEYHLPGNPVLAELLLTHLRAAGLRPAEAGEFTARAYFNGRLDLTAAEGVAATIAAGSEQELAAARGLMAGELARRLAGPADLLVNTLALLEVGIDFADEDVTVLPPAELVERIDNGLAQLRALLADTGRLRRLAHDPTFVLVGRPNAGKSTLLNALAGHERAVTSPVAGTTRDVLTADVPLARGLVKLTDAAGLEAEGSGDLGPTHGVAADHVERQMRGHALRAVESADVVVLVRDATDDRPDPELPKPPDLTVLTKCDLRPPVRLATPLRVSAVTGEGLGALRDEIDRLAFGTAGPGGASSLALNARHVRALSEARAALSRAAALATGGGSSAAPELVALELREALDAVGRVTGAVTPDDLLGRIFSAFCIGK